MTWTAQWQRPPPRNAPVWNSNEAIDKAWQERARQVLAAHTFRNRSLAIGSFVRSLGDRPLLGMDSWDIEAYALAYSRKCGRFHSRGKLAGGERTCSAGIALAQCPLSTGHDPAACASYRPLRSTTLMQHLTALSSLYAWLRDQGLLPSNPVDAARSRLAASTRHERRRRGNSSRKRLLTVDELRRLCDHSPPWRRIIYFLCAKWGLRIHEALGLNLQPSRWQPMQGWVRIPEDNPYGEKREGNLVLPVDSEIRDELQDYQAWRAANAKASPPVARLLLNGPRGEAWSVPNGTKRINDLLKKDALRCGILVPDDPRGTITTHCFRVFFVSTLENNLCPSDWVTVLKGDLLPGAKDPYFHPDRIREVYEKFGPKLLVH